MTEQFDIPANDWKPDPNEVSFEDLCKKVKISSSYGAPENSNFPMGTHGYVVTLRYKRKQITTPFYMGPAHTSSPKAPEVLHCLLSDASSIDNATSFEEWCNDLGYDSDSRKAEKIYNACVKIGKKLHAFLGDDFDKFLNASSGY